MSKIISNTNVDVNKNVIILGDNLEVLKQSLTKKKKNALINCGNA